MIGLPINLELRKPLNLTGDELMSKLKYRIKPNALKLELMLRDPDLHFDVRVDSPAAIDGSSRVGAFLIRVRSIFSALQVVVVKRSSVVVALNEPAARRVIMPGRQH